jgi:hypothetical protein
MLPPDLETIVDRELKRLPLPRAPLTLVPRVLAAADQWARRPWYARAWLAWPRLWQVASAAAAALLLVGIAWAITWAQAVASADVTPTATRAVSEVRNLFQGVEATLNATRVVWLALVQPVVVYAFGFVFVMFSACVLLGIAINRVVFGKAFQS